MEQVNIKKLREQVEDDLNIALNMQVGMDPCLYFRHIMDSNMIETVYPIVLKNAFLLFFIHSMDTIGTTIDMTPVTKRNKSVRLTKSSGSIFAINWKGVYKPAIYVGMANISYDQYAQNTLSEYPFFYVYDTNGISYWDHITSEEDVENQILILRVRNKGFGHEMKDKKFDFSDILLCNPATETKDVFENMEKLSDCTLVCSNGEVKTSRFLLSQRSKYFLVYFTKYSNGLNRFPMQTYKKEIIKEYLRFILTGNIEIENIQDEITETLDFCNYIQDFEAMKYFYELVYGMLTDVKDKKKITKAVKLLIYPNSK
jgi:hypothetical protein